MWSCEISEDRGPVHLVGAELTLGSAVAAGNPSSVGRVRVGGGVTVVPLSSKLLSQAPDRKFHVTQPHLEVTEANTQIHFVRSPEST